MSAALAPTGGPDPDMPSVFATLRLGRVALAAACLVLAAVPAALGETHPRLPYTETGLASWYGGPFHGRQTASGEIFDAAAISVAHPSLPFGTLVRITNMRNNRMAVAVVNDRGPYAEGRIVDCSEALARALGFARRGLVRVRLEVVSLPGMPPEPPLDARTCVSSPARGRTSHPAAAPARGASDRAPVLAAAASARSAPAAAAAQREDRYCVQIGAFRDPSNARDVIRRASVLPLPTFHRDTQTLRLAFAGPFESLDQALAALRDLEASGIRGYVRRVRS